MYTIRPLLQEVVSDGAAGLRAHLQQLEERLGGLEAENGRLRREAELQGREAAASAAERAAALAGRINALQDAVEGLSQDKQELQVRRGVLVVGRRARCWMASPRALGPEQHWYSAVSAVKEAARNKRRLLQC